MFVYSEMLALFAGEPYDTSLSDLSNLASHLTNTCLQTSGATILNEFPQVQLCMRVIKCRHGAAVTWTPCIS